MAAGMKQVWIFRIVHQDTGKPAQGVPVTVLEPSGNAAGYWVSEADGTVAIPRRDVPKLRLRVGLRTEDPIELDTATLGDEPIPLAAPSRLPPTSGGTRDAGERDLQTGSPPPPRGAEPHDVPGHVLYFQRLVLFADRAPAAPAGRDLTTALRPELQLDPLTLIEPGLEEAATDTVQMIRERTERMSQALRRRPLGVVDVHAEAPATAAVRTVRNTATDRLVTFHFFEPLERFRVAVRSPRARPVIFVPFRLPNVATPDVVRRFGYIFRRTLLDRGLLPDLERLLQSDDGWPRSGSRLLEHIEGNLLYYSTAIISAGDPAARHMALAKLRDPAGRPLTDVVENMVLGRVGSAIALPLRSAAQIPKEWRDALDAYAKRPPRVNEAFTVTIPHPGVWVTAQSHEPMQQVQSERAAG